MKRMIFLVPIVVLLSGCVSPGPPEVETGVPPELEEVEQDERLDGDVAVAAGRCCICRYRCVCVRTRSGCEPMTVDWLCDPAAPPCSGDCPRTRSYRACSKSDCDYDGADNCTRRRAECRLLTNRKLCERVSAGLFGEESPVWLTESDDGVCAGLPPEAADAAGVLDFGV